MGKKKFLLWSAAIALFISAAGAAPVSASDKTISSVPLRIDSDLEIGDRIGDIDIEIEDDIFGSNLSYLYNKEYDMIANEETTVLVFDYDLVINTNLNQEYFNTFLKELLPY